MDSLRIYNTLARDKQAFVPLIPGEVRMYVCGMTVYDYCHVGHARVLVVFDMVQRWLRTIGFSVTYVRNITDIDDKIIARAAQQQVTIGTLTERFIVAMHQDADALGVERASQEPRATDFVPSMLDMVGVLERNGYAYQGADGDVNYSVRKFANYGALSGKSLDDLRAGQRVATNDAKQDPLDFVLWKQAKPGEPPESGWDSKWGRGRPGWHIECSAMSCAMLGAQFDIHGGGQDLQFPHHENEIAQSEAATGKKFVNYWMHNGYVQIDNQKMSKSLGNFFTIRDVLKRFDPEVMRFFIVRAHYRSPLNYSDSHLDDARVGLMRLYTALKDVAPEPITIDWNEPFARRFQAAMNDDFHTALAVAVLFDLAAEVNRSGSTLAASQLKALGAVLGLLQREPRAFLQGTIEAHVSADTADLATVSTVLQPEQIEALITQRSQAKQARNYIEADRIRTRLLEGGVVLEDKAGGLTEWRRA